MHCNLRRHPCSFLLSFGWIRIISIAVLRSNLTGHIVNAHFFTMLFRNLTSSFESLPLSGYNDRGTLSVVLFGRPVITVLDNMNLFGHPFTLLGLKITWNRDKLFINIEDVCFLVATAAKRYDIPL